MPVTPPEEPDDLALRGRALARSLIRPRRVHHIGSVTSIPTSANDSIRSATNDSSSADVRLMPVGSASSSIAANSGATRAIRANPAITSCTASVATVM